MSDGPLPEITPANAGYWEGTAAGELRLRECRACGAVFRFAHTWCPRCWSGDLDVRIASGEGKVHSFTVVHMAPYAAMAGRVPYVIALVALAEDVVMMSNIIACDPAEVRVGMPVSIRFEQRGDVTIPQFAPAAAAG